MPTNESGTQKLSRAEQARINGAKSKGPVTEAGRARSQRAKLQHGRYARSEATGASFLLKNEDPAQFALFREGWRELLGPQSDAETEFLDGFIANEWRLIRFQAAETGLLNDKMRRNRPKVAPGIQHLSPADREQSRWAARRYSIDILGSPAGISGVTACQPIPWSAGDNPNPEDQNLSGGAAWSPGFAAAQGTPS